MQDNKKIKNTYNKEYYEKNKDKFKIYRKKFFDTHPTYLKNWWKNNGYFIKVDCEICQKSYNKDYFKRHKCMTQIDEDVKTYNLKTICYDGIMWQIAM